MEDPIQRYPLAPPRDRRPACMTTVPSNVTLDQCIAGRLRAGQGAGVATQVRELLCDFLCEGHIPTDLAAMEGA